MAVCNSWNPLGSRNFFYAIICYYFLVVIPLHVTALSFNLTNIGPQLDTETDKEGDAYVTPQGIQLTSNEINTTNNYSAGRAMYKDPLFLWDNTFGKLTDFNAYFSFVNNSIGNSVFADGLTFFLIPNGSTPDIIDPVNITPITHVGIDINSLNSSAYAIWNNDIIHGPILCTGSVNNNNSTESFLSFLVDLKTKLPEWVTIGFSAAIGRYFEKNNIKSWEFNSTLQSPNPSPSSNGVTSGLGKKKGENNKKVIVVGFTFGSTVLVGTRAKQEDEFSIELSMYHDFEVGTRPKKFSYGELFRATNYFAEEQKLGEGGFGGVFKGFLRELNSYIAVKRLSKGSSTRNKRLRHRILVQLLGWCHDKRELLLVYEFMENGSLDYHLYKEKSLLTWAMSVVHRDVKSNNVMLDSNFNAKLGDFGLARLVDHGKDFQTTILAETRGYMAPECLITSKANKQSNVYSFGVMALEIACGRKPIDLKVPKSQVRMVEWVLDLYGTNRLLEATIDPKICPKFVKKEMECLMIVGLWCAHPNLNLRPSIRQAIDVLNFEAMLPILLKMPVPTYLAPPMNASSLVSLTYGSTTSYNTNSSKFSSSSTSSSPSASLLYT
ncbi:hypothetical protein CsSME_00048043 [Camellia sinensis var. sinensis]